MIFLILFLMGGPCLANEVSIGEFIQTAWTSSAWKQAGGHKNEEVEQLRKSVEGRYLPQLSLEAIDTTGFPASSSDLRIGGLMGSPFRSGGAAGVIVEQRIYDFGRVRAALEQAKAESQLFEAKIEEEKLGFISRLVRLYLTCAQAYSVRRQNDRLMNWAELNLKETERLTKTGQRSIIDNSLVRAEINDLKLQQAELEKRQRSFNEQMAFYAPKAECSPLSQNWGISISDDLKIEPPQVLLRKAQRDLSQAKMAQERSAQRPFINAVGSAGWMEDTRLVSSQQNYSAGIGITFPFWNGGESAHREKAFHSEVEFQNEVLKETELDINTRLKSSSDEFDRYKESLEQIEKNLKEARATMALASRRYRQMEGPLIDVREAFKQLKTVETERNSLLFALSSASFELNIFKSSR
jgi:outer membrane protein TolC